MTSSDTIPYPVTMMIGAEYMTLRCQPTQQQGIQTIAFSPSGPVKPCRYPCSGRLGLWETAPIAPAKRI